MALMASAKAVSLLSCVTAVGGLPAFTPELGEELWKHAEEAAKASGQQHVCGYGTWGDSGQVNQWDQGFSPCWPSTLNMAATWDVELMARWSVELGREFGEPNRGQLGPGIDIARFPWNGRLGEYMSGEDPFLGSKMIAAQVSAYRKLDRPAVQVVKHFIPNTIETDRNGMTEVVDERTLFEVYYPPFQAAVDAGVSAVMCSYNLVKCTSGICDGERAYACASDDVLNKHLKQTMGFKGIVISDWDATKCQPESKGSGGCTPGSYIENDYAAEAGLDLEMPACMSFAGGVTKRAVEKETRLRWAYMVQGRDVTGSPLPAPVSDHVVEERRLAVVEEEGGFCCWWPKDADCSACVSGGRVADSDHCGGTWCGSNFSLASAGEAAHDSAPKKENWLSGVYKENPFGTAAAPSPGGARPAQTHVELNGRSVQLCPHLGSENYKSPCKLDLAAQVIAESTVVLKNRGGVLPLTKHTKVTLAGSEACASEPLSTAGGSGWNGMACNQVPKVNVRDGIAGLSAEHPRLECSKAGEGADEDAEVVVIVAKPEKACEGRDRSTLQLPAEDIQLIKQQAAAGRKVVVAINAPGPMITSTWDEDVAAIVISWLPGQQNGRGIAMALYGESYEASGRLPFTFPKCSTKECTIEDERASVQFGDQIKNKTDRVYAEKALIGYRWYHAKGLSVSYPFGFGLFAYGTAEVQYSGAMAAVAGTSVTVTATLQHSGPRAGRDVPQLYLSFPSSVPGDAESKPEWVLKGFTKTLLEPSSPVEVSFTLSERDLSYWDDAPGMSRWACAAGTFHVCVGANARDAVDPAKGSCTSFEMVCPTVVQEVVMAKKDDASMVVQVDASSSARILSPAAGLVLAAALLFASSAMALHRRRGGDQGGAARQRVETLRLLVLESQPVREQDVIVE